MQASTVAILLWTLAGVSALATLYPYLLYPALLRLHPVRDVAATPTVSDGGREFSLLFCAYNEARVIPDKIDNLRMLKAKYPALDILVYDDGSDDGTSEILDNAGLELRVIRGRGRTGKAHGMKRLASLSDRQYLVFTDANVELHRDVFDELLSSYSDPKVGGVCGQLHYVGVEGTAAAHAGGLYWRLEEVIKSLESRSGNVMGADGSIFSIRRALYPEFADTVLDDMTVSMAVVFRGYRLVKNPRVIAYERLVTSAEDDYRRRLRIATRVFHTHMIAIRPQMRSMSKADRWRWWSHRYLKWNGAFFIIAGYCSGVIALGLSVGWQSSLIAFGLTAAFVFGAITLPLGPISAVGHMLTSIFLSGLGVVRARQGRTVTVWKPPATR